MKSKTTLPKISDYVAFVPRPYKYSGLRAKRLPTLRKIIARERILEFEHYTKNLNMFRCSTCRECNIESKHVTDSLVYECKLCQKRRDSEYYTKNNLHPVWYLVDDSGNYVLDENSDREIQYHILEELACLTMYEKLLIRRCANIVLSVHLKMVFLASMVTVSLSPKISLRCVTSHDNEKRLWLPLCAILGTRIRIICFLLVSG